MPPQTESPVQTQLAIPVPDGVWGHGSSIRSICNRQVGRRRIFVQTDTGSVLGIELDRADNVQTVKKKMQSMLNVPTDQSALVFGDTVLKNDLSELRNDSPLLLTRGLQRSLSTPCLSPTLDFCAPTEGSRPVEVVGGLRCCSNIKQLIKEITKGVECGVEPVPVSGGLGGAYYFRNSRGECVAIVKPTDEEPFAPNNPKGFVGKMLGQPGLKRAVRVGETGVREVAAYLLDHKDFAKVPPTVLVKATHTVFHVNNSVHSGMGKTSPIAKLASCQQFVHHDFDASDYGTSRFPVSAVHRIGILDIRIFNTDRHAGNILIRKQRGVDRQGAWGRTSIQVDEYLELIPIDHGLCLPEALEDPYFEWLHWPQASLPFSEDELDYIRQLDAAKDVEMLRVELPMLRESCLRVLMLSTIFLKRAAAMGLCLAEIGEMMSREVSGMDEASELEILCLQAKLEVQTELSSLKLDDDSASEHSFEEPCVEQFQFDMDQEESGFQRADDTFAPLLLGVNSIHGCPGSSKEAGESFVCCKVSQKPVRSSPTSLPDSIFSAVSPAKYGQHDNSLPATNTPFASARCNWPFSFSPRSVSPRTIQGTHSPLGVLSEISPLVEDDEAILLECDLNMKKISRDIEDASPLALSLRSVSFSDRKQRCPNHLNARRPPGKKGFSASEVICKPRALKGSNASFLADMTEEEWMLFIDCFQSLLPEAFASHQSQNVSHIKRLGMSCQF